MKSRLKSLCLSLFLLTSCSEKKGVEEYALFVNVDKIVTNVESIELYVKESFNLTAIIKPNAATVKTVSFKSDNSSIATVSSSGKVEGRSEGKCNIIISSDENDTFKKIIPVTIKKEDSNKEKEGTIKVEANLDLRGLASSETSSELVDVLDYHDQVYAPFVNTYNTTSDGFLDLSDRIKLLNDINYYGDIEGETKVDKNNRILSNMKALFVSSTAISTLLSALGSSDANEYRNYSSSILLNFGKLLAAKNLDDQNLPIIGNNNLEKEIKNTPAQHSLIYVNNDYFSNAKLEQTAASRKCTYYLYQENTRDSNNSLSSLTPLLNYASVDAVKEYYTQENVNKLISYIKNNFDKLPIQYSIYYAVLRVLINSIDETSYEVSTSEFYNIDNKKAVDASFKLTSSGKEKVSSAIVDFINTRVSTSDNEELKNIVTNYFNGFGLTRFEHVTTFVNREGSGVNIYKITNNIEFNTASLSNQSLHTEILYKLDVKDISTSFFFEEETRQQSYRNK